MSDVIITGEDSIIKKQTEADYIEAITTLYDNLSDDERIKTGRPKKYRKPLETAKPKVRPGRKKRRHKR